MDVAGFRRHFTSPPHAPFGCFPAVMLYGRDDQRLTSRSRLAGRDSSKKSPTTAVILSVVVTSARLYRLVDPSQAGIARNFAPSITYSLLCLHTTLDRLDSMPGCLSFFPYFFCCGRPD
ncbi:unnamed protein product [Protopolystoma xenopodis]|uniref:Uncharacterized protein n=1 Tax=Protopolystoma xenopodis TaxID=117903 RepID=A0A448WQ26_9PLAT|nr:unnamed protein product [Protopolystoma xenopodis]